MKLVEKLLLCASTNIQLTEPVRIFDQNFQVKITGIS